MTYQNKYQVRKEVPVKKSLYGTSYFASVLNPLREINTKEGVIVIEKPYYKISVGLDTPKAIEYAQSLGLIINAPTESIPVHHVNIFRNFINAKGEEVQIEIKGTPDSGYSEGDYIGNGSKVKVTGFLRSRKKDGKNQMDLLEIEVSKLVRFERTAAPAQVAAPVKDTKLNDEIPF
jgi:hypothetical protein